MGANGKRGGGDRVLESRHLVGLFLGVVLLCGVFFTLGYVMGHTQYDTSVHAADSPPMRPAPRAAAKAPEVAANPPATTPNEWDFYTKKDDNHLEPAPKPAARAASPAVAPPRTVEKPAFGATKVPAHFQPPRLLRNSIVLQVAALRRQGDALALADALQQKRFPSFVVTPTTDGLYRVQVGPYANEAQAESAKRDLDREGFKAIIKH